MKLSFRLCSLCCTFGWTRTILWKCFTFVSCIYVMHKRNAGDNDRCINVWVSRSVHLLVCFLNVIRRRCDCVGNRNENNAKLNDIKLSSYINDKTGKRKRVRPRIERKNPLFDCVKSRIFFYNSIAYGRNEKSERLASHHMNWIMIMMVWKQCIQALITFCGGKEQRKWLRPQSILGRFTLVPRAYTRNTHGKDYIIVCVI